MDFYGEGTEFMKSMVSIRFTEKEKKELEILSELSNLTLSDYIRKRVIEGVNDSSVVQSQIQELKATIAEMKDRLTEKNDITNKLLKDLAPYIIKSSVTTEVQIAHHKDESMRSKYKETYSKEINQSKVSNLVKESFQV